MAACCALLLYIVADVAVCMDGVAALVAGVAAINACVAVSAAPASVSVTRVAVCVVLSPRIVAGRAVHAADVAVWRCGSCAWPGKAGGSGHSYGSFAVAATLMAAVTIIVEATPSS